MVSVLLSVDGGECTCEGVGVRLSVCGGECAS